MKKIRQIFILLLYLCSMSACEPEMQIITIENDLISVKIYSVGAELYSLYGKKSGTEHLWQGDTMYWEGRAPIMFPVNVRFKDNCFTYKGIPYEMPRMGLAINRTFRKLPADEPGMAIFEMTSDEETLQYYPFPFRLEVTYKLAGHTLINEFLVENTGQETMYFALGGHPGFNCPFDQGRVRTDYQYSFPSTVNLERTEILESLVQHNKLPFLNNESDLNLDDPRIPDGGMFMIDPPFRQISVGSVNKSPTITVDLGNFPNVNLWSPPGKPFACIEPMVAHHDLVDSPIAIEEKSFLIELPAGESRNYQFTIIIHNDEI